MGDVQGHLGFAILSTDAPCVKNEKESKMKRKPGGGREITGRTVFGHGNEVTSI